MIAASLTAGAKLVGVLEVLIKGGGKPFAKEEHLLLLSVADAIAFEYVVSSYCRQRQGLPSCKGCERPLGEWPSVSGIVRHKYSSKL